MKSKKKSKKKLSNNNNYDYSYYFDLPMFAFGGDPNKAVGLFNRTPERDSYGLSYNPNFWQKAAYTLGAATVAGLPIGRARAMSDLRKWTGVKSGVKGVNEITGSISGSAQGGLEAPLEMFGVNALTDYNNNQDVKYGLPENYAKASKYGEATKMIGGALGMYFTGGKMGASTVANGVKDIQDANNMDSQGNYIDGYQAQNRASGMGLGSIMSLASNINNNQNDVTQGINNQSQFQIQDVPVNNANFQGYEDVIGNQSFAANGGEIDNNKHQDKYQEAYKLAKSINDKYPDVTAAQAILETGKNLSDTIGNNNVFNIKYNPDLDKWFNKMGIKSSSTEPLNVWEVNNGKDTTENSSFFRFGSLEDAFKARQLLLNTNKYKGLNDSSDAYEYAKSLQDKGYATDPNYAIKLQQILKSKNVPYKNLPIEDEKQYNANMNTLINPPLTRAEGGPVKDKNMLNVNNNKLSFPYDGSVGDVNDYDLQRALQLYKPDNTSHLPSIDYTNGVWLKGKNYPTAWMEYYESQTNPTLHNEVGNAFLNENERLQYPKGYKANGGDINNFYNAEGKEFILGGNPNAHTGNLKNYGKGLNKIEGKSHEQGGEYLSNGEYVISNNFKIDSSFLDDVKHLI